LMTHRSRWAPEDKVRIVMESLNTSITTAELCRKYNVTPMTVNAWKDKFFQGGKMALTGTLKDPEKELQDENRQLKSLIGEFAIANDALKKALTEGGKRR
jgi:transposase